MTVATTSNKITYLGNGGTTTFPFTFAMPNVTVSNAAADLVVTVVNSTGLSTVISYGSATTQYQLVLNPAISPNPTLIGGTVTYNPLGVPIPVGSTLTIERVLPETQSTSLQNQGTLWQTVIEQALDYLTMISQQLQSLTGRAITAPSTDPNGLNYVLPSATARANTGLAFDSSGNVIAGTTPASGIISTAMQPVVSAATLAAGRTAFGLGNIAVTNIGAGLQNDGANNLRSDWPLTSDAGNTAVTSAFHMTQRVATGPFVYFLPRANTLWNGFGLWIFALIGPIALSPNAADSVDGNTAGLDVTIPTGAKCWITTDAAASGNWRLSVVQPVAEQPKGRLTLQTGQPVLLNDVANATTIFYTPDTGNLIPIFDGGTFIYENFDTDISLILDAGGHLATKAYDIFAFVSATTVSMGTGPAWKNAGQAITNATNAGPIQITSNAHGLLTGDDVFISGVFGNTAANGYWPAVIRIDANNYTLNTSVGNGAYTANTGVMASRGIGAATTQLTRTNGLLTNAVAVTLRNNSVGTAIPINQATYLGTFVADGNGNTTCNYFSAQARKYLLWNAYNQRDLQLRVSDPTATWNYNNVAIRASNGNATNSAKIVVGFATLVNVDFIEKVQADGTQPGSAEGTVGIGEDSVLAMRGFIGSVYCAPGSVAITDTVKADATASYTNPSLFGAHTYTCLEASPSFASNVAYLGTNASMRLQVQWRG